MGLKTGSVVRLKGGDLDMTVWRLIGEGDTAPLKMQDNAYKMAGYKDGDVICQWHVNGVLKSGAFKIEMLKGDDIS